MAVSELPGNPNAVWTVKTHSQGGFEEQAFKKCSSRRLGSDFSMPPSLKVKTNKTADDK